MRRTVIVDYACLCGDSKCFDWPTKGRAFVSARHRTEGEARLLRALLDSPALRALEDGDLKAALVSWPKAVRAGVVEYMRTLQSDAVEERATLVYQRAIASGATLADATAAAERVRLGHDVTDVKAADLDAELEEILGDDEAANDDDAADILALDESELALQPGKIEDLTSLIA